MPPAWPGTVDGGKPGRSVLATSATTSPMQVDRRLPPRAQHDGHVVAVDPGGRGQRARAASAASANGSVGGVEDGVGAVTGPTLPGVAAAVAPGHGGRAAVTRLPVLSRPDLAR